MFGFAEFRIPESSSTAAVVKSGGGGSKAGGAAEEYAWERAYERTWEAVEEDESGLLRTEGLDRLRRAARRDGAGRALAGSHVQRGMLRHLFLIVDMTRAMDSTDIKPNRAVSVAKVAQEFVTEYFDQNPISALGLIVARRGSAEKVSDLSPNRDRHLRAIATHCAHTEGDFSLQTALEIALKQLQLIPTYGTREVLLVHGAHASVDPGNILTTIAELQKHRVTVSCVSLPGEVYIATRVVRETGGRYSVPESYDALRQQVLGHCVPPPRKRSLGSGMAAGGDAAKMVAMGFPRMVWESAGLCACHGEVKPNGYVCPRCSSRICDLPATCAVCSLQLISAARLARSYHHLFPVLPFVEVPGANDPAIVPPQHMSRYLPHSGDAAEDGGGSAAAALSALSISSASTGAAKRPRLSGGADESPATEDGAAPLPSDAAAHQQGYLVHDESKHCSGCTAPLAAAAARFVCMSCRSAFCSSCDALVHETLHNCPGCC